MTQVAIVNDYLQLCTSCAYCVSSDPADLEHDEQGREDVAAFVKGITTLQADGSHVVRGDEEKDHGFSWRPCDCCQRPLGGDRYHHVTLK